MNNRFSERHEFTPEPSPVPYDDVPLHVRIRFEKLLRGYTVHMTTHIIYPYFEPLIAEVLNREPPRNLSGSPWAEDVPSEIWDANQGEVLEGIREVIRKCPWYKFYDICEEMYELILTQNDKLPLPYQQHEDGKDEVELFATEVNNLFKQHALVWHFRNGLIERTTSEYVDGLVEKARVLIREKGLEGPDEQFEKAIRHLNQRPQADVENCVKDAVGSLEGVARIISQDAKALLPDIIDKEPFRSEIHGALREAIKRVYGYRSDVGGVAHGQVGSSTVGIEEAEFVLGFCASAIVYFVNKFGNQSL